MSEQDNTRKIAKVTVDRTVCFSQERCIQIAPQVFSLDDDGISTVRDIEAVDDTTLLKAAEACPVQAIAVFDADGNLLYPRRAEW